MSAGVNVESIWPSGRDEEEPATPLSAPHLKTRVERESLILDDGEQVVEISAAIGPRAESIERLQQLAATALALVEELKSW